MRISDWSSDVCSSDLQLRWQLWPGDDIPESYLTEDEIQPEELYGAVVRRGFNIGEPIIAKRVMRPGDRGFLAVVLRPGFRAIAIRVNATRPEERRVGNECVSSCRSRGSPSH